MGPEASPALEVVGIVANGIEGLRISIEDVTILGIRQVGSITQVATRSNVNGALVSLTAGAVEDISKFNSTRHGLSCPAARAQRG